MSQNTNQFCIPNAEATAVVALPYLAYKFTGTDRKVTLANDPADVVAGFSIQPVTVVGQLIKLENHGNLQCRCDGGWAAGAALTASDSADKDGYLKTATSGDKIAAYAIDACVDGAIGYVLVAPRGQAVA